MNRKYYLLFAVLLHVVSVFAQTTLRFENQDILAFQKKCQLKQQYYWVEFYTTWCGYCKKMDQATFVSPDVISLSEQYFQAFKLNAESEEGAPIAQKYGINGFPTVLVFDPNGELIAKNAGFLPPNNFIDFLNKAISKNKIKGTAATKYDEKQLNELYAAFSNVYDKERTLYFIGKEDEKMAYDFGTKADRTSVEELKLFCKQCEQIEFFYKLGAHQLSIDDLKSTEQFQFFILDQLSGSKNLAPDLRKQLNEYVYEKDTYLAWCMKLIFEMQQGESADAKAVLKKIDARKDKDLTFQEIFNNLVK